MTLGLNQEPIIDLGLDNRPHLQFVVDDYAFGLSMCSHTYTHVQNRSIQLAPFQKALI